MGQAVTARMELEQRLRLAIRDRQFCCAFQPKVDMRSQEVVGFEALIRWRDERGDDPGAGRFVGLAIELGLINPITQFMVTEAVNAMEQLDEEFGSDTTISVNVAAKQASDLDFMRSLAGALGETAVAHASWSSSPRTRSWQRASSRCTSCRCCARSACGSRSTISAPAIRRCRRSPTSPPTRSRSTARSSRRSTSARAARACCKAIESLSHALGMTIIAEGVETFEELAYLQAATRIRYAQGYYFAKPFFLDDFARTRRVASEGRPAQTARERAETRAAFAPRVVADARSR